MIKKILPDGDGQLVTGELLAAEPESVSRVQGLEVHQLVGHLVVVLQRVHQRGRLDPVLHRQIEGEADELGVAGRQRVVIGGPVDEVVGEVGATLGGALDVVDGEVELLEREAADLADHAGDQLVGGLGQRMALRPGRRVLRTLLHPEEAVGVQPQRAAAKITQGVQRVADHQPHAGEARVEPVDRGLALLEVVQIDPTPLHPVLARAPAR